MNKETIKEHIKENGLAYGISIFTIYLFVVTFAVIIWVG